MTKYNTSYAKPNPDSTPAFAPIPLTVVEHHHEEWDEPVFDPETGEPVIDPETGEQKVEHKIRDYDTTRTSVFPSDAENRLMGYLRLRDMGAPAEPAPEGYHYERRGTIEPYGDGYKWTYDLVADPPPPPRRYSVKKVAGKIRELGYTQQVREALMSANAYEMFVGANYLRDDDPDFLAMRGLVQQVTGLTDDQIEEVLSECIWEEG